MSRIGKLPIDLPKEVSATITHNKIVVKGPNGELSQEINPDISCKIESGTISLSRPTNQKRHKAFHGLYRSLINNMVKGVSEGYTCNMELIGVGYKADVQNNILELSLGYSHNIFFVIPNEVKVTAKSEKGKPPLVTLQSIDKQLIGQIAAKIRSFRKVEPYKGKGIRFVGENVRRKAGKTAAK